MWHAATGEVRIKIPKMVIGSGESFCFKGFFELADVDEELEEVTSFDDFTTRPYEEVDCDEGGPCEGSDDTRFAYRRQNRRLVDADAAVV